jgi:hypothetical protein
MMKNLDLKSGDIVQTVPEKLDSIVNIKINVPKNVVDPVSILEFELRQRNILTKGDKISSKIFEKSYDFIIKEIQTRSGMSNVGALYDNNIISNINFEIEYD